ncbi:MAG: hypothetical protein KKI02_01720 [Planctomycetes bacterium]|nr:hypothetical protein [Planctomycetota bacterium]
MRRYTLMMFGILAVLALFTTLSGCKMPDREAPTAKEQAEPQPAAEEKAAPAAPPAEQAKAAEPAEEQKKTASEDDLKKKRKELKKKDRQVPKLERDMNAARHKLEKARLSLEHTKLHNAAALAKAEAELDVTMRKLQTFNEQTAPSQTAWGELGLRGAEDRYQEAQEELEQLELMYNEDEFADQTKEIVLERGRRRLQRSQRDLELRRIDFATLQERTLPIERREHELRVVDKEEALKRAREKVETSMIDEEIGLINAEGEIIRLEHEMVDTHEEIEELREEVAKMEKEVAEAAEESQE